MNRREQRTTIGFTVVELLMVIVVIGILAVVTVVAYNGIQTRARDAKRVSDIAAIKKQLINYQTTNGSIPGPFVYGSTAGGGWDNSTLSGWLSFIDGAGKMPKDPSNSLTGDPGNPSGSTGYGYFFYCYNVSEPYYNIGYYKESGGRTAVIESVRVERCT